LKPAISLLLPICATMDSRVKWLGGPRTKGRRIAVLKTKISAVEAQMKARLTEIRATFDQTGDKGTALEKTFREFLREYLPRRLQVGMGEIIDTKGHRSNQTDIVIVNEDHPLTFTRDLPGLFFIEGVCAVAEVKTTLTSDELDKTLKDSLIFRQLDLLPGLGTWVSTNPSDLKRFYKSPPSFLVAFNSQLKLSSVLEHVQSFLKEKGFGVDEINTVLDAIFIIDQGSVINFGDGLGAFQLRIDDQGTTGKGWIVRSTDKVLFDMIGWLSSVMPKMIRHEPILPSYFLPHGP